MLVSLVGNLLDGVTTADVVRVDGLTAPAIFIGGADSVRILSEPLALAFSELERGRPYKAVVENVKSIAALISFYISQGRPEIDRQTFRSIVQRYLLYREAGDIDRGLVCMPRRSLERELANISRYSEFCEREYGYFSLVGQRTELAWEAGNKRSIFKLLALNEADFFSHLALLRTQVTKIDVNVPGRKQPRNTGASPSSMHEELAWDLITAERNPTYRAIWILGFFGGPRLSEVMNLWACDVLPGTFRSTWFPGDPFAHLPLVVVANPWLSRWCGVPGDERFTREDFLKREYGLTPRPQMAETEAGVLRGKAAGFKGTSATSGTTVMRQLFWANEDAATQFADLAAEHLSVRRRLPKSKTHPYLFVNTDSRKPEYQGDMLTLSNVRKAFERALRRIGRDPYRWKQSPHGMRHTYSDIMRKLCNGDTAAMQIFMGHRARESQDAYGTLDLGALKHALAMAPKRPA